MYGGSPKAARSDVTCSVASHRIMAQNATVVDFYLYYECSVALSMGRSVVVQLQLPARLLARVDRWVEGPSAPEGLVSACLDTRLTLPPKPPVTRRPAPTPAPTPTPAPPPRLVSPASTEELKAVDEVTVTLPARVTDAAVGLCGSALVLTLEGRRDLWVYRTGRAELARLPIGALPEGTAFAAGGNRAVTYNARSNVLGVWDLVNGRLITSRPSPIGRKLRDLSMGSCAGEVVIARYEVSTPKRPAPGLPLVPPLVGVAAIGLPACNIAWQRRSSPSGGSACLDANCVAQVRASPDLSMFTVWSPSTTPHGLEAYVRSGSGFQGRYRHEGAGTLLPSTGGRVFCGDGTVLSGDLSRLAVIRGHTLVPTTRGDFVVGMNNLGGLTLFDAVTLESLARMGDFPGSTFEEWDSFSRRWTGALLTPEKRTVCDLSVGRCLFLAGDDRTIVERRFDVAGIAGVRTTPGA